MTTDEFIAFCKTQQAHDAEARSDMNRKIERLADDVASIHSSRHAAQENLANVVNEMRIEHNTLEKQVASLVVAMQELVIAMKGSYGGQGLVAQVNALAAKIESMDTAHKEARGMSRLIGWGGGLLGAAAAIKGFLVK